MLTLDEVAKALRRAKITWGPVEVSPELRGWSYDKPPVKPPAYAGLALSDFAYGYCPTYRNVYLKYVLGERGAPSRPLVEGQVLHSVLFKALEDFRRYAYAGVPISPGLEGIPEELREKAEALYKYVTTRLVGEYQHALAARLARSRDAAAYFASPIAAQVAVDGAPLGLSYVVADGLALGAVVEFKFGPAPNVEAALAGYAMAIEADWGVPVDYGIHVQISVDHAVEYKVAAYPLGDSARSKFLEARDEAIDVVASGRDPGAPPQCPKACPFYGVCHAGGGR